MSDSIIANLKAVLSVDSRGFDAGINNANKSLQDAAKNARNTASGFAGMDGGFRTAAKGADVLKNALSAISKATVVLGIVEAGKAAIETATKFDSYSKALESTLGSSARVKAEMRDLKEIAKLPGIGLEESIQSFQRFVSVGLDVSRSKKLLEGLGKVNAKGGGSTEDFNEASRQFSQILSAGKITDENLGVIKERLPAFAKVLRDTFKTTTAAGLKDAGVNVDQFLAKVIPAMEAAKGVTNTAQNSFDNLGSATTDALNTIGSAALPLVTGAMDALSNAITKISGDFTAFAESPIGKSIADNFGKGFAVLGDAAKVVGTVVTDALKSVGLVLTGGDIKNGLRDFSAGFRTAATAIKSFVSSNGFKSFVTGFVGGIKTVIDAVRPAATFIVQQFEKVVYWFQQNMPLIQRTVTTVLTFIREFWAAHGQQILAVVEPIWNQIKLVISTALNLILGTVKLAMQIITGDWSGAGTTIKNIASEIWSFITQTFSNLGTYIVNAVVAIVSGLADLNARIGAAAKAIGKSILDGILAYLSGLWESVKKSILGAFDKIGELASDIIAKGKTLGEWIVSGIKDGLAQGNIGQALLEMVQTAWANIKQTTKDLIQGTEDAAKKAQEQKALREFINGPAQGSYRGESETITSSQDIQSRLMGAYAPKAPLVMPLPKGVKSKITGGDADKINTFSTPDKNKKEKKAPKPEWMSQYEAFVSELRGLKQQVVDNLGDPLESLANKYNKLDFSKGGIKRLADQFLAATKSIKNADLDKTISDQNETVRKSILKLRDPSIQGAVAADLFGKAYKNLTLSERERVGQLVLNKQEEDRLTKSVEAGKKASEARKKAEQDRKNALKELAKAAAEAVKKESDRINDLLGSIAKLKNEYRAAISGNDFDKFLARSTGKTQAQIVKESGIFELGRQQQLFDATQAADQAGKLEGLNSKLRGMREELGLVKFANTEARLAWEIFGTSIDKLTPEIVAKIKAMVPEFERLGKLQKLKAQMEQVRGTIKDVFRDAFQASLEKGQSFFETLIGGFKSLLQRIVAEWAANQAVRAIFDLFGKRYKGLDTETASAEKHMVTGAAAIGASAIALTAAAAKLAGAAAQAAASTSGMAGIPGVGMGFGGGAGGGVGQTVGAVGGSVLGGIFSKQIGGALGSFGGPVGTLLGSAVGGLLGGLFGGGKKKFFGLFANGGRPPVGYPSIVGDGGNGSGAEIFWPDHPGTITSNRDSKSILSGLGGGGDIHLAKGGTIIVNDAADVKRIQATILAKKRQKSRLL